MIAVLRRYAPQDELYLYTGAYTNLYDPECNCFYGTGTTYFTGGTWRFEGAGGEAIFSTSQDAENGGITLNFEGVIVY